jgi:tetratricopeptide (TPR) repeat protein
MRKLILAGAVLAASALAVGPSSAVTLFVGGGPSGACFDAARAHRNDQRALDTCNSALSEELLTAHGRAGTLVNRGIILLARGDEAAAMADFEAAIRIDPGVAEGHTNRGMVLLRREDYRGAVDSISRGLELDPYEPHKALYNRAVAYEALQQNRAAYDDYRRAAELAPDWEPPRAELTRFSTRRS